MLSTLHEVRHGPARVRLVQHRLGVDPLFSVLCDDERDNLVIVWPRGASRDVGVDSYIAMAVEVERKCEPVFVEWPACQS